MQNGELIIRKYQEPLRTSGNVSSQGKDKDNLKKYV